MVKGKKKVKEEVKKVKEEVDVDMKALILEFLQDNPLGLRRAVPNLIEASYEEKPDRVVLTVNSLVEPPVLKHNGVEISVELKVAEAPQSVIMVDEEDGNGPMPQAEGKSQEDDVYHREFSEQASKLHNMKEAVGPHSTIENSNEKRQKAFIAWQKRHSAVKIAKG
jgi:hypothetical protein